MHRRGRRERGSGLCGRARRYPGWGGQEQGHEEGGKGSRGHPRAPSLGRVRHSAAGPRVSSGHRSRRVPVHARNPVRLRSRLGRRDPVRAARELAVPPECAVPSDQRGIHEGLPSGEAARWRRHLHPATAPPRRPRSPCSGSRFTVAVEPDRQNRVRRQRPRPVGERATVRSAQPRHGRWLHRLLRDQVPLQPLASRHGDPKRRYRRQPQHQRRRGLDPAGADSSHP